jgi:predicted unusual protein kinase regulating ubiquinone biosynthesis (AarF/ABC1/UbiB family)
MPNDPRNDAAGMTRSSINLDDGVAVPAGRWNRLSRLGLMASSVAVGMVAEGARHLAKGQVPSLSGMLLTPSNVKRVTNELAKLRGAAMKVGQLMSMDAGELMPPALSDMMSRLRSEAVSMPMSQLVTELDKAWGHDWSNRFERFTFTPAAAASIGQVHHAITREGQALAIKVQYPGVRESIDSDVDNVAALLRITGLLPSSIEITGILEEAKKQLHAEADYQREQDWMHHYGNRLSATSAFLLPKPHTPLTTPHVLAMSWVEGSPIESLDSAPQVLRDHVAEKLFDLALKEIFEFRVLQSDPNFANYRFNHEEHKIVLLDFGATRELPQTMVEGYRMLMQGGLAGRRVQMYEAATQIGYFSQEMTEQQITAVMDLFEMACEPMCHRGSYDFAASNLPRRMHDIGMTLAMDRDYWHTPPIDALFLHRKLAGTYLLAARLKARVNIRALAERYITTRV